MQKHLTKFSRAGLLLLGAFVWCLSGAAQAQDDLGLDLDLPSAAEAQVQDTAQDAGLPAGLDLPAEPAAAEEPAIQPLLPGAEPMQTVSETPPKPSEIQEVTTSPAEPPPASLASPKPDTGEMNMPNIPDSAQGNEKFNEDLFFDAEALVPESELASKGAPSKVDPSLNPGSRLIISTKTHNPGSKEARMVAAERAMKLGRYESALEIYNGLYTSNTRDPNVLLGRATALQHMGEDDEAIMAYEELLAIRPKNLEAQVNMQGLLSKRYPAVALRNLVDLQQDNPGNVAIVAQLAVVSAQLGHYADAIRYLGVAASMEPENANHVYNMAVIADRAGDKKSAIRYYEDALEIDTLYGSGRSIPRDTVFERLAQLR